MTPKMPSPGQRTPSRSLPAAGTRITGRGQMLMGDGGYQFPGYTYTGNSNHASNAVLKTEGCISCHMAEQSYPPAQGTGKAGGHTMNIYYESGGEEVPLLTGCKQSGCHPSTFSAADLHTAQQGIEDSLAALRVVLVNLGWVHATDEAVVASSSLRSASRPR